MKDFLKQVQASRDADYLDDGARMRWLNEAIKKAPRPEQRHRAPKQLAALMRPPPPPKRTCPCGVVIRKNAPGGLCRACRPLRPPKRQPLKPRLVTVLPESCRACSGPLDPRTTHDRCRPCRRAEHKRRRFEVRMAKLHALDVAAAERQRKREEREVAKALAAEARRAWALVVAASRAKKAARLETARKEKEGRAKVVRAKSWCSCGNELWSLYDKQREACRECRRKAAATRRLVARGYGYLLTSGT